MTEEYFFDTDCNSAFRADKHGILFRQYRETDCPAMAQLFYDTVHTVNVRDYTRKQVEAWADGNVDIRAWHESFLSHHTVVAEKDDMHVIFLCHNRVMRKMTCWWDSEIWQQTGIWIGCMSTGTFRGSISPPKSVTVWKRRAKLFVLPLTPPSRREDFLKNEGIMW